MSIDQLGPCEGNGSEGHASSFHNHGFHVDGKKSPRVKPNVMWLF